VSITPADARAALTRWREDPVRFAEEILGVSTLYDRQKEVLRSIVHNRETYVPSANATGKDYLASIVVPWFLCTNPDSVVITTASTQKQVETILWGEMRARIANARVNLGGEVAPVAPVWKIGPRWYAMGITANDQNAFAGFRSSRTMLVRDEAAGIDPLIWEASQALLAGERDRVLSIGNPLCGPTHPFAKMCSLPDVDGLRRTIRMSALETPNYLSGRDVLPGLASRTFVDGWRDKYGKDSVVYGARVLGKFPGSAADGLISMEHLQLARDRRAGSKDVPPMRPDPRAPVYLGVDPARYGDDLTVIYAVQGCHAWLVETIAKGDSRRICSAVLGAARVHNARGVAVDSTGGYGAGPFDMLKEEVGKTPSMRGVRLLEVNFGAKATDPESHANRRTELWWGMRDWIRDVAAWDGDELIVEELLAARYKPHGTGIALEAKEEIKKRIERSPDRADALALAIWAGRAPLSAFNNPPPAPSVERDDRDAPGAGRLTASNAFDGAY
jgi:hypothetical protein